MLFAYSSLQIIAFCYRDSVKQNINNNQAGKGDKPRNCFSKEFKRNFDQVNWGKNKSKKSNQEKS